MSVILPPVTNAVSHGNGEDHAYWRGLVDQVALRSAFHENRHVMFSVWAIQNGQLADHVLGVQNAANKYKYYISGL